MNTKIVASAIYHRMISTDLLIYHTIKLVTDGRGCQNKNKIWIGDIPNSGALFHSPSPQTGFLVVFEKP
ncbi:hypothetical protein PR048_013075, partial [Dryococelus australis]